MRFSCLLVLLALSCFLFSGCGGEETKPPSKKKDSKTTDKTPTKKTSTEKKSETPKTETPSKKPPVKTPSMSLTATLRKSLPEPAKEPSKLAFSPDGTILATGSGAGVMLWNLQKEPIASAELADFEEDGFTLYSIEFSADGKTLCSSRPTDTAFWNLETGEAEGFELEDFVIEGVTFCPDAQRGLFYYSSEKTFLLCDLAAGEELWRLPVDMKVERFRASPAGDVFAAAEYEDDKAFVTVRDVTAGEQKHQFENGVVIRKDGFTIAPEAIAFSADGSMLAAADVEKQVRIWNVKTGKLLHTLKEHTARVRDVAFCLDGKVLVSAGGALYPDKDNNIRLWDSATGELLKTIALSSYVDVFAVSRDGKRIAAVIDDEKAVSIWDLTVD